MKACFGGNEKFRSSDEGGFGNLTSNGTQTLLVLEIAADTVTRSAPDNGQDQDLENT
jgi:hypothetical protein